MWDIDRIQNHMLPKPRKSKTSAYNPDRAGDLRPPAFGRLSGYGFSTPLDRAKEQAAEKAA